MIAKTSSTSGLKTSKEKGNLRSLFLCRGEALILNLFLLLLVLSPLPFGSNRGWASDLFALSTGLLLLGLFPFLKGQKEQTNTNAQTPWRRLLFAASAITISSLWAIAQTSPHTPATWHHPFWYEVARFMAQAAPSVVVEPRVSLTPLALPESLARLLAYTGCFLLAFFLGRNRDNAQRLVKTLGFAGMGYAFYGLCVQASGTDTILWYPKWAHTGFLTATFANKNSYATYAGLGFLCSLVFLRQHLKEKFAAQTPLPRRATWAQRFKKLKQLEKRDSLAFLSPVLILAALVLSGSRAGLFSTLVGVSVFLIGLALNQRWSWKRLMAVFGLLVLLLSLLISLGGDDLAIRIQADQMGADSKTRLEAYRTALEVWRANPVLGYGLGSFDSAFGLFRGDTIPFWFQRAHNDYLEMMIELGAPAAFLLFAALLALASCCAQGALKRKRDAAFPVLGLAATALVGTHALADFSLQIPAIAATYATLLGLGVSQSYSSRRASDAGKGEAPPCPSDERA